MLFRQWLTPSCAEACAQALQWELGFDSLVAMMNVGVEANAMTRTSLCSALCSLRGAWTMALATWKRTADVDPCPKMGLSGTIQS